MIATILMYGVDPSLLWKSRLILEQTGARIFTTMHFEQKIELMGAENPDVLILCHTLPMDQCQEALILARELRPDMKTLVLVSEKTSCDLELHNGEAFDSSLGPQALLTVVDRLLGQSNPPQART